MASSYPHYPHSYQQFFPDNYVDFFVYIIYFHLFYKIRFFSSFCEKNPVCIIYEILVIHIIHIFHIIPVIKSMDEYVHGLPDFDVYGYVFLHFLHEYGYACVYAYVHGYAPTLHGGVHGYAHAHAHGCAAM